MAAKAVYSSNKSNPLAHSMRTSLSGKKSAVLKPGINTTTNTTSTTTTTTTPQIGDNNFGIKMVTNSSTNPNPNPNTNTMSTLSDSININHKRGSKMGFKHMSK